MGSPSLKHGVAGGWARLAACCLLLLGLPWTSGQGLLIAPAPANATRDAAAALAARWGDAKALREAVRAKGVAAACSSAGAACAPAAGGRGKSAADAAVLALATSPAAFSSADLRDTRGARVLGPAMDQRPCQAGPAFAVLAAAEAAAARGSGADVDRAVGHLSVADLAFCSPPGQRGCSSGAPLASVLAALQKRGASLRLEHCLPFRGDAAPACNATCDRTGPATGPGRWSAKPLAAAWDVQRHIRAHGAVVTRFDIYNDFAPFFANASARGDGGAVYAPGPAAALQAHHAVALVGYDNDGGYWVARNSWGPAFGHNGNFKVKYGTAGVLSPGDTFGLGWAPTSGPRRNDSLPVAPSTQRPGCSVYKAREGDYLSSIAARAGVPLESLLADNAVAISDLDALAGRDLLICPPAGAGQLAALRAVKAAVDPSGLAAFFGGPAGGGKEGAAFCAWDGVRCDAAGDVVAVALNSTACAGGAACGGALPPAAALSGLPKLRALSFGALGLKGSLPADWSTLGGLEEVEVAGNRGLAGALPAAWGGLSGLKRLSLRNNALEGPVPAGWGDLSALSELQLGGNPGLTGCLPGALARLAGAPGAIEGTAISRAACDER
ncbi:hypothetical protein Rsub_11460 [Raphidocelis subcapitata]|uniref:LysM domain-containing protein n=1 Tax=Raphidocelis subcapitata TaxID=307507 RepID=A0A2V0PGG9_9CHLO|nr:hypothetical protein Rsub_11460 [Raphidocelis subcapitata]|eukprot:GBF98856.1 hypothetical protein Rsub_11460 [Raphidocelis subcapitata]